MHDDLAPKALAELAGKTMFERDPASQKLGMLLAEIGPGYARMTMPVREDMLNGHRICHGGYIFMLADSAFAFACNSYNFNTVGAGCTIDYLAPGREGDLDPFADTLDRRAGDVLLELLRLPVHARADQRAGRAADDRADDGTLGGRAGHLADHTANDGAATGPDGSAGLGVGGATRQGGDGQERENGTMG